MKLFKKVISSILAISLSASLFAACNITSNNPPPSTSTPPAGEAPSGKKEFEGETIRLLAHDNPYVRSLRALAPEFEALTGAKVEIDPVGQAIMEQRLQLDFASKTGSVDVAYMPFIYTHQWASSGWVQPIDDYVERDKDELDMDDFIASAVDTMRYEDKLYGLPGFAEIGLMAYRKDVFEKHGITEAPKTWDELLEVAKKINSKDMAAIALRTQRGQGMNIFVFPMLMWAYGGGFVKDFPTDLTPILNSEENLKALNMYKELISYGPSGAGNFTNSDIIAAMQSGKTAIIIDGTSVINEAIAADKNQFSDQIELALVPSGPAGSAPAYAVHGWAIPSFAKNPDVAWEFIKWATSSEVMKKVGMGEGGESYMDYTRESVGNVPEIIAKYSDKNISNLRNEALKSARADYRPLVKEWAEIGDIFGGHINAAVNGQETPKEALDKSQKEVYEILKNAGYDID